MKDKTDQLLQKQGNYHKQTVSCVSYPSCDTWYYTEEG